MGEWTREKRKEYMREYRAKNKDRIRGKDREYYSREDVRLRVQKYREENKDYLSGLVREWKLKNKARMREKERERKAKPENARRIAAWNILYCRRRGKTVRDQLADEYIKDVLTKNSSLTRAEIPQEVIELKRLHLTLKRERRKRYGKKGEHR